MNSIPRYTLWAAAVAVALSVVSCGKKDSAKSSSDALPTSTLSPDLVVAKFNNQNITLKELDEKISGQLEELDKQKHEMRKQALDAMVVQGLVKAEATKAGLTEEQWLKREIEDKVTPPTEEEMKNTFNANVSQLPPGAKFEDYKARIADYLGRPKKQELAKSVFDQLKAKANVTLSLPDLPKARKQVAAEGPSRGPDNAPITLVEFSDFQCPYCSKATEVVEEVMKAYPGKVRLVFRQFPLSFHPNAPKAAEAALCANDQGKFWEYHDTLFKNQQMLAVEDLKKHAGAVGLDAKKFGDCLDSGSKAKVVSQDMEAGQKVGVSGTPAFFINGMMLSGAQPVEEFKKIIDEELKAK